MRVYLPATLDGVAELLRRGQVGPAPLAAFAVTPALREWYVEGDLEELEYAATTDAARASLRLLQDDPAVARRRVVLAAEVPDRCVQPRPDAERSAVWVAEPVPLSAVVSAHVDEAAAEPAVAAAAAAVLAADAGDDDARFTVDEADGHELLWYATQELASLISTA